MRVLIMMKFLWWLNPAATAPFNIICHTHATTLSVPPSQSLLLLQQFQIDLPLLRTMWITHENFIWKHGLCKTSGALEGNVNTGFIRCYKSWEHHTQGRLRRWKVWRQMTEKVEPAMTRRLYELRIRWDKRVLKSWKVEDKGKRRRKRGRDKREKEWSGRREKAMQKSQHHCAPKYVEGGHV